TPELAISCDWTLEQYLGFLNTLSASKLCKQTLGEHVLDDASGRIAPGLGAMAGQARQVSMPLSLLVARRPA
ncbi:hypothetical protein, partial [Chromobacterium haemolyticum]|uniref:hypothetical protein n=1 Tax=Chromobacterium haemolyticum TaxID=394935 RepID=UPI0019638127